MVHRIKVSRAIVSISQPRAVSRGQSVAGSQPRATFLCALHYCLLRDSSILKKPYWHFLPVNLPFCRL